VLAERAYIAEQAQTASVRRHGDSTPGPRLGEIVAERLNAIGGDPDDAQWDAKKRGDGSWQVQLGFTSGGRLHTAEWVFDPRRRHVLPNDDNAARMSLPGAEPPQPAAPPPGEATVTRLAPRISNARHERPAPVRPSASEPAPPAPVPSLPPAPSVPVTAEPRRDVSRPPAAERNSWPQPASREPAPVPLVAAETGRENHQAAPPPAAEAAAEPPAATGDTVLAEAGPEAGTEQTGRQSRKAARGRRSSVPSWDEIMFGSSRQRD
ncbi:MAG: septation protein SepH, partial [Streptosporangiaceae bacterium]